MYTSSPYSRQQQQFEWRGSVSFKQQSTVAGVPNVKKQAPLRFEPPTLYYAQCPQYVDNIVPMFVPPNALGYASGVPQHLILNKNSSSGFYPNSAGSRQGDDLLDMKVKQDYGEKIFLQIERLVEKNDDKLKNIPKLAVKITQMMLEKDNQELKLMLSNKNFFETRYNEALAILKGHEAKLQAEVDEEQKVFKLKLEQTNMETLTKGMNKLDINDPKEKQKTVIVVKHNIDKLKSLKDELEKTKQELEKTKSERNGIKKRCRCDQVDVEYAAKFKRQSSTIQDLKQQLADYKSKTQDENMEKQLAYIKEKEEKFKIQSEKMDQQYRKIKAENKASRELKEKNQKLLQDLERVRSKNDALVTIIRQNEEAKRNRTDIQSHNGAGEGTPSKNKYDVKKDKILAGRSPRNTKRRPKI